MPTLQDQTAARNKDDGRSSDDNHGGPLEARRCPALNKKSRRQPLLRCKTTGRPDSPSEGSGWHGGQLFLFRRPVRPFFCGVQAFNSADRRAWAENPPDCCFGADTSPKRERGELTRSLWRVEAPPRHGCNGRSAVQSAARRVGTAHRSWSRTGERWAVPTLQFRKNQLFGVPWDSRSTYDIRNWCNRASNNADSSGVRLPAVFSSSMSRMSMKWRASASRTSFLFVNGWDISPNATIA